MAKTTASARGPEQILATPPGRTWGTETMQMRWWRQGREPRSARRRRECLLDGFALLEVAVDDFSILRRWRHRREMPTARASRQGHDVDVSPNALSVSSEVRIESGMETATMSVLRQPAEKE